MIVLKSLFTSVSVSCSRYSFTSLHSWLSGGYPWLIISTMRTNCQTVSINWSAKHCHWSPFPCHSWFHPAVWPFMVDSVRLQRSTDKNYSGKFYQAGDCFWYYRTVHVARPILCYTRSFFTDSLVFSSLFCLSRHPLVFLSYLSFSPHPVVFSSSSQISVGTKFPMQIIDIFCLNLCYILLMGQKVNNEVTLTSAETVPTDFKGPLATKMLFDCLLLLFHIMTPCLYYYSPFEGLCSCLLE